MSWQRRILRSSIVLALILPAFANSPSRVYARPKQVDNDVPTTGESIVLTDQSMQLSAPARNQPALVGGQKPDLSAVNREAISQPWTLDSLLSIAQSNNPTLRQAQLHIDAAQGKALQAGLYPNPTLQYAAEQIGVEGTAGEFHGGLVSQRIVRGGKLQLSRAKYLRQSEVAQAQLAAQYQRVTNDIKVAFYQALSLQYQVSTHRDLVKSAEDWSITQREAFNMGQANAATLRKANAKLQEARLTLLSLENGFRRAIRTLTALVGIDLDGAQLSGELEATPALPDFNQLLGALWDQSPELEAARAKLEVDRVTVRRELAERISDVTLEGGVGYNFEADQTVAAAGVSFPIKIYDRNQGTVQQARADLARQCAEIERLQEQLRRDLSLEYETLSTASHHVAQFQQTILPDLKEAYRLMLESYQQNRTNWNDVLLAQQDYFMARSQYFQWLGEYRKSESLIDGMLLTGGLMAAPGPMPRGHIDAASKPR